jgi:hypothetical protein
MDLNSWQYQQTLTEPQREHLKHTQKLWAYYNGQFKKWLIPKLLPNGATIDDNVKLSLSKKVVQKGNNFLFGKGLTWQLASNQEDKAQFTTQEKVLADIWGNQETQNAFLSELGISGGVSGTFYIQIVSRETLTKIKYLDPQYVYITPDPTDLDQALDYDLRYFIGKELYRIYHSRRDNGQWEYAKERWNHVKWEYVERPKLWEFDWPFIVHGKNLPNPNSFYGASDLEDAEINDTINQVASNLNRIIRIFAHPVIWGYGFGSSALSVDSSKVITSTAENAKLEALELARDLSSPQEYLKFLRTIQSEITATPESDPDRLAIGAQSGFALEVLFNDLLLKTGIKRSFYGKTLIELNRRLLELSGYGNDNQTTLHWPNPLPVDKVSETTADTFDLMNQLVSKRTMATKRGYDYDQETEYMNQEQTNNKTLGEEMIKAFRNGQG